MSDISTDAQSKRPPWQSPIALAVAALLLLAVCLALAIPQIAAPRGEAGTGWRAEQGAALIEELLGDGAPHPTGSAANDAVRARIVARLRAAGYTPAENQHFQCFARRRGSGCARLTNIVAVREGASADAPAILATAHYDSVPASPGVGDDMAGTAVMLALAERMASAPPSRNAMIFLFTDAEESGMRGAAAFAEQDPLMARVSVVVNVEARGVSGPSMLFETGPNNANLARFYAQHVRTPVADSMSYEIYRILPNDTDFSVYSIAGRNGYNFAFTGGASLYHSVRDDLAHIDRATLQHHGDNIFALAPALADADLATLQAESNAAYSNLPWGFSVWPAAWNAPLGALGLIALLAAIVFARRGLGWRGGAWAIGSLLLAPALLFVLGWLASYPLAIWPGAQSIDHPAPWPGRLALLATALVAVFGVGRLFAGRGDWRAHFFAAWLVLSGLALWIALVAPGAATTLLFPALITGVAALIGQVWRKALWPAALLGIAAIGYFWVSLFLSLEVVLGFPESAMRAVTLTPLVWALAPLAIAAASNARRAGTIALAAFAAGGAVCAAFAANAPAYTPERPRGMNIEYYDDRGREGATPHWQIQFMGPPDRAYLAANTISTTPQDYLRGGVQPAQRFARAAPQLDLAPPTFERTNIAIADGARVVSGVVRAGRNGVLRIAVGEDSGVLWLRAEGQQVWSREMVQDGARRIASFVGQNAEPLVIEIAFEAARPAPAFWLSERSALPDAAEARALTEARPADAAPIHDGDGAAVVVRVTP